MSIPVDPDMSIFGKISRFDTQLTLTERSRILGTCFGGLGMFNCVSDEQGYDPLDYNTPYYNHINELKGQPYCTQCCGTDPDLVDEWSMYCPVDSQWETNLQTVTYIGAEFRFARRQTTSDLEYITCALRSNACNYTDEGETIECDVNDPNLEYVVGYELDVRVQQYQENWKYWRGVSSCSAVTISRSTPLAEGEWFREKMYINRKYNQQDMDMGKSLVIICLVGFLALIACIFCRRDTCQVCQSRLIIFFNRCWICRLFGAHLPDPILLQALATKGATIQMESERPERFPGAKAFTGFMRCLWRWVRCKCCDQNKIKDFDESRDLSRILDPSPEPPPTRCCRGDDPDTESVFEFCCGCLVSLYDICCKKKGGKVKKIRVVELPLQPYQIYDTIRHSQPPMEVLEAKAKAVAEAKMKEDLELYGDLSSAKIEEGTDTAKGPAEPEGLASARRRMALFKQGSKAGSYLYAAAEAEETDLVEFDRMNAKTPLSVGRGGVGTPSTPLMRKQSSFKEFLPPDAPGSANLSRGNSATGFGNLSRTNSAVGSPSRGNSATGKALDANASPSGALSIMDRLSRTGSNLGLSLGLTVSTPASPTTKSPKSKKKRRGFAKSTKVVAAPTTVAPAPAKPSFFRAFSSSSAAAEV